MLKPRQMFSWLLNDIVQEARSEEQDPTANSLSNDLAKLHENLCLRPCSLWDTGYRLFVTERMDSDPTQRLSSQWSSV